METPEENHHHIIKGKRTKRVRPQSPIPFIVTANSSNIGEGDEGDPCHIINDHKFDDDEEDMANCLILLANSSPNNNSKKFMEVATMGYECKTCNRTFPSFQALGGHRASHKKPKTLASSIMAFDDAEEFRFIKNKNKCKVHECSVCGAEFMSGQALGGHMRRHRTTNTTLSLTPLLDLEPEEDQRKTRRKLLSLDLDLNLPAAPEDDQRESNSKLLVFSAASSLVDCHY